MAKTLENGTEVKLTVKVGTRYSSASIPEQRSKIDGEEHLILQEDDVLAIIED